MGFIRFRGRGGGGGVRFKGSLKDSCKDGLKCSCKDAFKGSFTHGLLKGLEGFGVRRVVFPLTLVPTSIDLSNHEIQMGSRAVAFWF